MSVDAAQPGLFVTLEGGEGAGKSTQIARLRARLEARGREVVTTREPGGSACAEAIRTFILSGGARDFGALAETMLFAAARADHVAETIRPALARGAVVLCDRFTDSTRVYQGVAGQVPAETIRALEPLATGGLAPDLTLILDVPADLGRARADARRRQLEAEIDRFEAESNDFHASIRNGFLTIARAEPERCVLIDASGDADAVEAAAWSALAALLDGADARSVALDAAHVR